MSSHDYRPLNEPGQYNPLDSFMWPRWAIYRYGRYCHP
jgi:hypothetical protein